MLPGLIYNLYQLELAGISVVENVNKLQNCEACIHFLASEILLTQVRLPYESRQLAYIVRMSVAFYW